MLISNNDILNEIIIFQIVPGVTDLLGYQIAVGPSADVQFGAQNFDPTTLPYICSNITTPSASRKRKTSCVIRKLLFSLSKGVI